jgi:hypothetical protein
MLIFLVCVKGYKIRGEIFSRTSELIVWFKNVTESAAAARVSEAATKAAEAAANNAVQNDGKRITRFSQQPPTPSQPPPPTPTFQPPLPNKPPLPSTGGSYTGSHFRK